MGVRLELETLAARAVGTASRAAGRGGGTTLPGKLLWKVDPGAVDALAARLSAGVGLVSATNGKTTTTAMAARILGVEHRLAWNRAGANLLSGIASALVSGRGADFGLFEVDEAALPEAIARTRPRAVSLANLFRDQLDRYGELEILAERWREAVTQLPSAATLVVNGDDPVVADLADGRRDALRFGLDDPRHARPALQHAADSKYCVRCGTPYEYAAAYVGHLGDYRCPACGHARPPLDVAAREIELVGLTGSRFRLDAPAGTVPVELALPGLYNVYNAAAASSLAFALGASPGDRPRRARAIQRGLRALRADRDRHEDDHRAPDQEPGRCQRGAAHAGDRRPARPRRRAERRDRGRAGRVLDLGRRLRAASPPRRPRDRERRPRRRARPPPRVRRPAARSGWKSSPRSSRRSTAGWS